MTAREVQQLIKQSRKSSGASYAGLTRVSKHYSWRFASALETTFLDARI
jgi:hypothetical protein